ncbi:unnamed protein product [Fusarium graminearum]|uniref:Chromosome 4, complete genome n=2 Tax=Gibberella zeae TaxID=5518 RepID=A0A098DNI7_GIBZE|nr:unnamed protein product [Fusarium graminearum]CAF3454153.1 unnamed protein product [Fusarium graminearum]CAG1991600.1 unnamed protein product [Fusarium graminearum]CAG2011646.1 unnamed protein product [Fusarium graminearum]CEF82909.1 unnamed protein product [Fusarium graminearum]
MSNLPTKDDIKAQAVDGRPITQTEAAAIASEESSLTGGGPIKGGAAATAQSMHDRQKNFLEKAGDVVRKAPTEVTKEDAAEIQRAEASRSWTIRQIIARAKGGPPGKGSTAADVQSVADTNAQA